MVGVEKRKRYGNLPEVILEESRALDVFFLPNFS